MSILGGLLGGRGTASPLQERRGTYQEMIWGMALGTGNSAAGVSVTPDSAMTSAAVYACVRVLSETIASLPLITYERVGNGRERANDYYLYGLLHDAPNEYMTSFEYRETVQGHLALWGNAFSQLEYNRSGQVTSIFPLRPDRMMEIRTENGVRMYKYQLPDGKETWLNGNFIWHLKAFGDGLWGYSPVELMRNGIGLTMALEKYGSKLFGNGARPGGVLEHPGKLGPEAAKNLRVSWTEAHGGLDNSNKVAILEEGLKWHEVGMPNDDAQFLETRKFQTAEIARIWRVPPHMIGDLERATFSNIEELGIEFVQYTLAPWLVMWEQSIRQNLMLQQERKRYYSEFLVDGLLRGNTLSRYQAYQSGIQSGWLTRADAREKENLNPIEGLEKPLVPMNMMEEGGAGQDSANRDSANQDSASQGQRANPQISSIREQRAAGFAQSRYRLSGAFRPLYAETLGRVLRREVKDVKAAVERAYKGDGFAGLRMWMDGYYQDHANYVKGQVKPVNTTYGMQVADLAAKELDEQAPDESVSRFTDSYSGSYAARHVGISQSKLEQARAKAIQDERDEEEALNEELDTWPENRAASAGHDEAVRFNNAMAKMVYGALGVTYLRSVAFGDSCPYCNDLDGKVIGIEQNFISAGGELKVDGVDEPLRSSTDLGHAPYHDGCDCMVVAG